MLSKIGALLFLTFLAVIAYVPAVFAQQDEAAVRAMLVERDAAIKDILGENDTFTEAQHRQLKQQINGLIDFAAMSRLVLGPEWADLSDEQRASFVDVFSRIVRSHSLADLEVYHSAVTFEKIDVVDDSAHVTSTTIYEEVPVEVVYTLGFDEATGWRIHDIILDGVSTAEGYARSFRMVIRQRGFNTLMESLRRKVEKMEGS